MIDQHLLHLHIYILHLLHLLPSQHHDEGDNHCDYCDNYQTGWPECLVISVKQNINRKPGHAVNPFLLCKSVAISMRSRVFQILNAQSVFFESVYIHRIRQIFPTNNLFMFLLRKNINSNL